MTQQEFINSLAKTDPPEKLLPLLEAMWFDAKGNWNKAHEIAQDINTSQGALVHAYLHRKEGDQSNAGYWYSKAGNAISRLSLEDEWEEIVASLFRNN